MSSKAITRFLLLTACLTLWFISRGYSQTAGVFIEGFEPDYAGRTLTFYSIADPVSKNEEFAFHLRIGPQGRIQVQTGITGTLFCYSEFDSYLGKLILVPGSKFHIKLPPLKEKTFEESKNPYFKPIEIWIMNQSGDPDDLTSLFARYDQHFYQLSQKYFTQIYYRQQRNYMDSVKIPLDKEFGRVQTPEFRFHQVLQMKNMEAGMMRAGREKLISGIRDLPAVAWKLPSFAELTDRLFTNTFSLEVKTPQGSQLRTMVARNDLQGLKKWTESYTGVSAPLADVLLIKFLHDAFYSGEFSKNAILQAMKAQNFTQHPNKEVRAMASAVSGKLQFLYTGTDAPGICLPTLENDTICSSASTRPYQYILFADLEIPVCREQVKYLKTIHEKIGQEMDILLILTPSTRISNHEFIRSEQIPGTVVVDTNDRSIGRRYKIRSYPSALLLNRDHKVVLSPAKTPLDGFEYQFPGKK
jgi:hypothetical protein